MYHLMSCYTYQGHRDDEPMGVYVYDNKGFIMFYDFDIDIIIEKTHEAYKIESGAFGDAIRSLIKPRPGM